MANLITPYTGSSASTLVNALLAPASGIVVDTVQLTSAAGSANFYDGGLQGIGAGILLTSGTTPGTVNNSTSFGSNNGLAGDAALDAVVNTVFQTQSYNATKLTFSFTVSDPTATSVSFDLVFGSEEYPEWVDSFVDVAVVLVNGENVALFNHDPAHPLSVISPNLAAGYFVNNANGALATQYDGVSSLLKFVSPIKPGVNTITIAIADTGDGILDSGIFVANLSAGNIPGSGVVSSPNTGTSGDDTINGSAKDEYFDLQAGDDAVYAGAGDDIVVAGAGKDTVYGGSGADEIKGDAGDDLIDGGADSDTAVYSGAKADYNISFDTLSGNYNISAKAGSAAAADGTDTLVDVEFAKFGDASTWSLGAGGVVSQNVVTPPVLPGTNQPGTLFLSGIGGQGQILTAKVSDADGVAANAVTYAWQANGISLGASGSTFTVGAAQVGQDITVTASYTDLLGHAESLASAPKTIAAPGNGDFAITLLNLKAPLGASVMNPLTTLVENAIELGVSPNEASLIIKKALGISATVDLQHFDSWAVLQANPGDAAALAVEKKLVQVAVLTSLGSDESGMALTQAILLANSSNKTLNLASTTVIGNILGMDPASALVHEIWDRNDTIASAKAVGTSTAVDQINGIWNDLQSGLSVNLSDSIGTLSVHINQAPIGSANAALADGTVGSDMVISVSELLSGFSDPEGKALSVSGLAADHGSVVAGAGFFTITPDAGYSGPVELTYQVMDDQGLSAAATQLFVVTAPSNVINGTAGNDKLMGTVADEVLNGFAGNDILDGKAGMDSMAGGDGSDTYYLRNVGDVAIETNSAASGGVDKVYSYLASHTLGSNIETGRIMTSSAASLSGNELNNTLYAGTGSNQLDGGSLAATDIDTASYAYGVKGLAGVNVNLSLTGAQATGGSGTDTLVNIENLVGSNNNDMLTGNSLANSLSGGAGQDSLTGGAGADRLTGGLGADTFIYTAATDSGLTGLSRDTLIDFSHLQGDHIDLSAMDANTATALNDAFSAPVTGGKFSGTSTFTHAGELYFDNVHHILYGNTDADAAAEFAIVLVGVTTLDATDFVL